METKTLAVITRELAEVEAEIIEAGGEITPELEDRLTQVSNQLLTKIDNYQYILERLESSEAIWKGRKVDAQRVEKSLSKARRRLKDRLLWHMQGTGKKTVQGASYGFSRTKSGASLSIDETKVPTEYKIRTETWSPDKERIRAALNAGQKVPGCELVFGEHLRSFTVKYGEKDD